MEDEELPLDSLDEQHIDDNAELPDGTDDDLEVAESGQPAEDGLDNAESLDEVCANSRTSRARARKSQCWFGCIVAGRTRGSGERRVAG